MSTKKKLNQYWKEYCRRIRAILKSTALTDLNSRDKAKIRKLSTQTRKLLEMYGALYSQVNRIYVPNKEGGKRKISIESSTNITKQDSMVYRPQNKHKERVKFKKYR